MRENGLPKVLAWRWAPCAAVVLGTVSFIGFMLVAIPEHIGHIDAEGTSNSLRFGSQLPRTQAPALPQNDWSRDTTNTATANPSPAERVATRSGDSSLFPKRGFTPPLERPAAPAMPPQPAQPQLNVPPPVPVAVEPPAAPVPPTPQAPAEAADAPSPSAARLHVD